MPCHFEFDSDNKLLRLRLEGQITPQVMKEYYRLASEYVLRTRPRAGIWDMTEVTSLDVSTDDIARLARTTPALPEPERPRIIVAPNALVFGLARMFQALGEGTRPSLRVVRTLDEACALLGVRSVRFEPLPPLEAGPAQGLRSRS